MPVLAPVLVLVLVLVLVPALVLVLVLVWVQHDAGLVVPPRTGSPPGSGSPWPGTQHIFLVLLPAAAVPSSPWTPSVVCWHASATLSPITVQLVRVAPQHH